MDILDYHIPIQHDDMDLFIHSITNTFNKYMGFAAASLDIKHITVVNNFWNKQRLIYKHKTQYMDNYNEFEQILHKLNK